MKKILFLCSHDLKTHKQAFFLLGLAFLLFLLRLPSLFEPYWYGDEGIYQVVGRALREGRLLYQGIWDNKPPLLYIIYAIFNSDLFFMRVISMLTAIFTIIVFFFLGKSLFKKKISFYTASFIFTLLLGLPLLEGNIANAENFMLLPIVTAGLLTFRLAHFYQTKHKKKHNYNIIFNQVSFWAFTSGVLLSAAFLTKTVAIFDLAAFTLFPFFVYPWQKKEYLEQIRDVGAKTVPLVVGFVLPVALTLLVIAYQGIFLDFFKAVFSQSAAYVSFGNEFITPWGFLIFKLLLLALFLAILLWQKDRFTKAQVFIMLWFGFAIFNAFFAQRPYTHYLLVLLPSFCLVMGEVLESKSYRFTGLLLIIFTLAVIPKNFWIYGKIMPYYQNFVLFVSGQKSTDEYRAFFDEATPGYYEVAQFIVTHTKREEPVFIWGNAAQVYVLSGKLPPGRLTVSYHVTFYQDAMEETIRAIETSRPKYIILLSPMSSNMAIFKEYVLKFVLSKGTIIYERTI